MGPFPFSSLVPRGRRANPGPSAAATRSVTWISPGSPWDSIRLAVFTVSPQRSYMNLRRPITPVTTGLVSIPIRTAS
jgi:hypothetical protein